MAEEIEAGFWDRKARLAVRQEDRDAALLARIQALALATPVRRRNAAALIADDYPHLLTTMPSLAGASTVVDPANMVLSTAAGAQISQYSFSAQGAQARESWAVTALEVSPLVRRVIVDRQGVVDRIGLTLNLSHARLHDLRIKIIAPSGRAVEIESGTDRSSSSDDIQIPPGQLRELLGESLAGTWSISVRDENLGVAGQLVGWNLKLNSQGAVEYFQRGLNIPDPVERETDNLWFDETGRYAVARAQQSDSARIWDLAFAEPVRAVALPESEVLIGLDATARRLVTASQDRVNLWDTATGDKVAHLPIGAASSSSVLTADGNHLLVERRGDTETRLELWSIDGAAIAAELTVAGVPSIFAVDASGNRVAVADFDRAVRVWNLRTSELLGQFDLQSQPSEIGLSADGSTLAVVHPGAGFSLWDVDDPRYPLLQEFGSGAWQFAYSSSGTLVAAGRPEAGFQVYKSDSGELVGPRLGVRASDGFPDYLAFSQDERLLLTGSPESTARLWRVPVPGNTAIGREPSDSHVIWSPGVDQPVVAAPDGSFLAAGDPDGHVHFLPAGTSLSEVAAIGADVSFVGHGSEIQLLSIAASGDFAASMAADNTIRVWRATNGEPLPFVVSISGAKPKQLKFSPGGKLVAALAERELSLIDVESGTIVAEFGAPSEFNSMSFVTDERLYLGLQNGSLQRLDRLADGQWNLQEVWQGPTAIRLLNSSPSGKYLVLVDANNLASQFLLEEGHIGTETLQLPSRVLEIAFNRSGTRALFRTQRWIHRASSSTGGLTWMQGMLVPRVLHGANIVNGNGTSVSQNQSFLPILRNGFIELFELSFGDPTQPGLFGSRQELLDEWRPRVSANRRAEFEPRSSRRSAVTSLAGTGSPMITGTFANRRPGILCIPPAFLRLNQLPHKRPNATGITGTGRRSIIFSIPGRNRCISPSGVKRPSGNIQTIFPASSSASTFSNAVCINSASSDFDAIGIAFALRNMKLKNGILNIL